MQLLCYTYLMKISHRKKSFGLVAKDYQKYRKSYDQRLYQLIFSLISKKGGNKHFNFLDIGCGTGKSTEPLLRMRSSQAKVFGCDPDKKMLYQARINAKKLRLPITYVEGSAEKLPFANETFDLIVSGTAFHWFPTKTALTEIKRKLKKNAPFVSFWTLHIKTGKPTVGGKIFKKYRWKGIPVRLRDTKFIKHLFRKNGLKHVMAIKIPFLEKMTLQESIGGLKTGSRYALMSPQKQKEFIKEITKTYKEALGERKYFSYKKEICICYGFK